MDVPRCGVTMQSLAQTGHVHECTRPKEHKDHLDDPDHYCRGCNRFFYFTPDKRFRITRRRDDDTE